MAITDNPGDFIVHQFRRAVKGDEVGNFEIFEDGNYIPNLDLDEGDRVYGVLSSKFFFTSQALIIRTENLEKIKWDSISHCSSKHGHGGISRLKTYSGEIFKVNLNEFGMAWGRISQLYHRMIAARSSQAPFGHIPLTIDAFFLEAKTDDCLGPNRRVFESLDTMQNMLHDLEAHDNIDFIRIKIIEYENREPQSDGIILGTPSSMVKLEMLLSPFAFSFIKEADIDTQKHFPDYEKDQLYIAIWD